MPHDHAGHAHLDAGSGDRRVAIAIWANALLTVAQIVGGILSGSLALIADALHNFSDMASLVIAFAARKIARRPADARMTFGYGRIEIVAALVNYTTLIIVGFYLIYEGGMRMIDPPESRRLDGGDLGWRGAGGGYADGAADVLDAEGQREHPRPVPAQPCRMLWHRSPSSRAERSSSSMTCGGSIQRSRSASRSTFCILHSPKSAARCGPDAGQPARHRRQRVSRSRGAERRGRPRCPPRASVADGGAARRRSTRHVVVTMESWDRGSKRSSSAIKSLLSDSFGITHSSAGVRATRSMRTGTPTSTATARVEKGERVTEQRPHRGCRVWFEGGSVYTRTPLKAGKMRLRGCQTVISGFEWGDDQERFFERRRPAKRAYPVNADTRYM